MLVMSRCRSAFTALFFISLLGCESSPLGDVEGDGLDGNEETTTLDSLGIYPNDGVDDGAALQELFESLEGNSSPTTIQFSPGIYQVSAQYPDKHLWLKNTSNVTLLGSNSVLEFGSIDRQGLVLQGNSDTTLSGLTIQNRNPPFLQGTILGVNLGMQKQSFFDMQLTPGFQHGPLSEFHNANQAKAIAAFKNNTVANYNFPVLQIVPGCDWLTKLSPSIVRVFPYACDPRSTVNPSQDFRAASLQANSTTVLFARTFNGTAIQGLNNTNVSLKGVKIPTSPGVATLWQSNEGLIDIDGLEVVPKENYWPSTNGGAVIGVGNRARFHIRNSSFKGMADDGVNLHARGAPLVQQVTRLGPRTLRLPRQGRIEYRANDRLVLVDRYSGANGGSFTVASATFHGQDPVDPWYGYTLEFKGDSPELPSVAELPRFVVFNSEEASNHSVIEKNHFFEFRGRAVILRSSDSVIRQNKATNLLYQFAGISMTTHVYLEGPYPQRNTVSGNVINAVSRGINGSRNSIIFSSVIRDGGSLSPATKEIRGLVVQHNTITSPKGYGMSLANNTGLQVLGNYINSSGVNNKVAKSGAVYLNMNDSPSLTNVAISDPHGTTSHLVDFKNTQQLTVQTPTVDIPPQFFVGMQRQLP